MQMFINVTSKEGVIASIKAFPVFPIIQFVYSSVWTIFYDYLFKQRITIKEALFDVFVTAFLESILGAASIAAGPCGSILFYALMFRNHCLFCWVCAH